MAQATYTIGSGQSGTAYRTADNNGKQALLTTHKGSSQPSYREAGMIWCDDSANPLWTYKAYDGTDWITIGTLNTSTNLWTPANAAAQNGANIYAADAGSTDAYAITPSPAFTAYSAGLVLHFKANTLNTGAATLNVNSLGAIALKKNYNQDLVTGDIQANQIVSVVYDGTNFQAISITGTRHAVRYFDLANPAYATAATFTVSRFSCRDSTLTSEIQKSTSTTVDLGTTGLNGIAQSSNLTGTVAISGGTVTGTGTSFTTDFIVGEPIWTASGASRVTAISTNTSMTIENTGLSVGAGATYRRGGEARSTAYYLYAITDGTTPGLILSARSVALGHTLVDLPSGYNVYRELPFSVCNDASSNIVPFTAQIDPSGRTVVDYTVTLAAHNNTVGATNLLDGGTSSSYASVVAYPFMPRTSKKGKFKIGYSHSSSGDGFVRQNGDTSDGVGLRVAASAQIAEGVYEIPTDASQTLQYKVSAGNMDIALAGYIITEVA